MAIYFDASFTKVASPTKLAHIVLQTSSARFKEMAIFYKTFLGAEASYENQFLSFITYDDEHHRIVIVANPGADQSPIIVPTSSGLHHIGFTFNTLEELALAYVQRKSQGILPWWSVNHGPTTSIHYQDPDGNHIETQIDNCAVQEASEFMDSKSFAENPIGVDFDPDELVERLKRGEDQESLKKRPGIGPRVLDTMPYPPEIKT